MKNFAGRNNSKRALTLKLEPNLQPINQVFIGKSRENMSLEKKLEGNGCEFEKTNIPTSVIHVKGLNIKEVKLVFLINLFSNFGNIKKIIFFKEIGVALIEFTMKDFAGLAMNFLNNKNFLGSEIQVFSRIY